MYSFYFNYICYCLLLVCIVVLALCINTYVTMPQCPLLNVKHAK